MRKLVLGLATSTLAFGACTLYLWRELKLERSRQDATVAHAGAIGSLAIETAPPGFPTTNEMGEHRPFATSANNPLTAPADRGGEPDQERMIRREAWAHEFLAKVGTPEGRARFLADSRQSYRVEYAWAVKRLSLSEEEFNQLVELRAREDLASEEALARCTVDPTCSSRGGYSVDSDQQRQILSQLLGAERARQFTDYQDSFQERRLVAQLRADLTDQDYLSSELSESLISALHDENRQVMAEARAAGHDLVEYGTGSSMFFYVNEGTPAQKLASAQANAQRQHLRAAQVLNAQQLQAFDAMQADAMTRLRGELDQVQGPQ